MSWFYHSKCLLFFVFLFIIDILLFFLLTASSSISERSFLQFYFIPTSAFSKTKAHNSPALHTTYVIVTKHTGANTRPQSTKLEPNFTNFTQKSDKQFKLLPTNVKAKPFHAIMILVSKSLATISNKDFFHVLSLILNVDNSVIIFQLAPGETAFSTIWVRD